MARSAKDVGAALGALVGLAVDACQSHHDAHGAMSTVIARTGGESERKIPDPHGEIGDIKLTVRQSCPDSWTGTAGQVRVNYQATVNTAFAHLDMHPMPADAPMSANTHRAAVAPANVPAGLNDVVATLAHARLGRGMYVGRLCPNTGGTPDVPVLIYLDGI